MVSWELQAAIVIHSCCDFLVQKQDPGTFLHIAIIEVNSNPLEFEDIGIYWTNFRTTENNIELLVAELSQAITFQTKDMVTLYRLRLPNIGFPQFLNTKFLSNLELLKYNYFNNLCN